MMPGITYIKALYAVYGRVEKLSDLMYQFEHTHEKKGEKLSAYIVRIDQILHQIIMKKGVDPKEVDKVRLEQTLQGARPNHPIALQLLLKGTNEPPSYPELMGLVREEEAILAILDGKEARLITGTPQKNERVAAQSVSVEGVEDESDEEYEWGEHSRNPMVQSTPKPTWVKPIEDGTQAQAQVQQALLRVMGVQAKNPTERMGALRCYQCRDPGHFRAQCPKKDLNAELLGELVKMLKTLLKDQPAGNSRGSQ